MYYHGQGVEQDNKRAVTWYTLAADQGHANAQCNLGFIYGNGNGVTQDYKRAVELFTLAADQSLAKAQYNLGTMYENGQGVKKSKKQKNGGRKQQHKVINLLLQILLL